jgi:transposase InsO family protein
VPANHGVWRDNLQCRKRCRNQPRQPNEQQAIDVVESRLLWRLAPEHVDLVAKNQDLGFTSCARPEQPNECAKKQSEQSNPGSPWQNCFAERLIGSIRRECVDHVVALGERHLREVLKSYASYYNTVRTHRSLAKDAPLTRPVQRIGRIVSYALVGGLHHQYVRI